jgi:group I intron endonuclease
MDSPEISLRIKLSLHYMKASSFSFGIYFSCPISSLFAKPVSSTASSASSASSAWEFNKKRELTGDKKKILNIDNPQFFTGFTDAEGCFYISISKDNAFKTGWRVRLSFSIVLHSKDKEVLECIKNYLKVGIVTKNGSQSNQFRVQSVKHLVVIINHFEKYCLKTKKQADYELFKQAFYLLKDKKHVTFEGLHKIVNIKASMNLGLSDSLKEAFPSFVPAKRLGERSVGCLLSEARSKVENIVFDPYWIAGFTSGRLPWKVNTFVGENRRSYSTTNIRQKGFETSLNLVLWGTNLSSTVGVRFTRSQLAMIKLPLHIKSIMVGLILSDAWARFENKTCKNALLGFSQSGANSIYVWYVFNILSHYCSRYPLYRIRKYKGKLNYSLEFKTRSMPCITELYYLFYLEGKKVIPLNIYELLTPVALAHLLMGDGVARKHGVILCTDSYSIPDVVRLMNVLMIRYQLDCLLRIHMPINLPRIYIRERSMPLLRTIVRPHMHYSMVYKISPGKAYTTVSGSKDFHLDPWFITGFIDGNAEGSFYINIKKSPTATQGYGVVLVFQLAQHLRDEALIRSLIEFFKCGTISFEAIYFRVEKFSDIINKIIPFFSQYYIVGEKSKDFQDWCAIAELLKDKKHLTREGLENIRKIQSGMYSGRYKESETSEVLLKNNNIQTNSTLIHKRGFHSSCNLMLNESSHQSTVNTKKELSGDYVAGLCQADGKFSAVFIKRTRSKQDNYHLDLKFSLHLRRTEPNKNLLFEIKNKFDNKGNLILYKKQDNTILYQITNQKDLLNHVIPFFMNYPLRGEKLLSFLRFKYLLEVTFSKVHLKNKDIFLSLLVIAAKLNPMEKLGNKIRYLNPEQQYFVINNIQPEGVDISKLTESIANFKPNPLSLDFARGCLETNTNNFRNLSVEDQNYIREKFLPPSIELWRFKEYYLGLNQPSSPSEEKSFKDLVLPSDRLKRSFSTKATQLVPPQASKVYKNADKDKLRIISENKGKSGIYRWTNLTNGKSYIGSSVNLSRRFREYYSIRFLVSGACGGNRRRREKEIKKSYFSTYSAAKGVDTPSSPAKIYKNSDLDKLQIIQENKGKAGVYRWINLLNGCTYIGSSRDLGVRMKKYFSITFLERELKKGNSIINVSLLKNGYSNFSLEILEYCAPDNVREREQYYLTSLKPDYNILKVAGSFLGYKHSEETRAKLKGRTLTAEHLAKLKDWALSQKNLERLKKLNSNLEWQTKRLKKINIYLRSTKYQENLKAISLSVQVFDTLTNEKTVYYSISEAARSIGCTGSAIVIVLKNQREKGVTKLVKKRYMVFLKTDESKISATSSPSRCSAGIETYVRIKRPESSSYGHFKWKWNSLWFNTWSCRWNRVRTYNNP